MKKHGIAYQLLRFMTKGFILLIKCIAFLVGHEILIRKRAEAQSKVVARREVQRRINEFVSVASHELKTPLTSIKGNVQLMGRRLKISELAMQQPEQYRHALDETRDLLERTDQQLTRLTRLVNVLLESARINGNTMDLLFELCDLNIIIREVIQNTRHIPSERTIELDASGDKTILVMADASRIKQAILHYLINAHKFSHIDHPIKVLLQEEGRMVRVSVQDRGPGIPLKEHQRIWERFYRVTTTNVLNGSEVGLGLGLHVCRTIIEQHHGQVGVYSHPGQGSTFWFILPLLDRSLDIAL